MIFVFAEGGTGSVYFSQRVRVGVRPDIAWGFNPPLKQKPKIKSDAFRKRGGIELDLNKTIEENLVDMLMFREGKGIHTMLSGRCSQTGWFLTDNEIRATCFVRHPLHSLVSFLDHQHPEHAKQFGGFNSLGAVRFYAGLWNEMTDDFIHSENRIYRFEYLPHEIENDWLRERLSGWNNSIRNRDKLDSNLELELYNLVQVNFYTLYDHWDI